MNVGCFLRYLEIVGGNSNFIIGTALAVASMPGMIAADTDRMQIFSAIMKDQRRLHGSQQQDHQQKYGKYPFHPIIILVTFNYKDNGLNFKNTKT
jgi:hypothetical protein